MRICWDPWRECETGNLAPSFWSRTGILLSSLFRLLLKLHLNFEETLAAEGLQQSAHAGSLLRESFNYESIWYYSEIRVYTRNSKLKFIFTYNYSVKKFNISILLVLQIGSFVYMKSIEEIEIEKPLRPVTQFCRLVFEFKLVERWVANCYRCGSR